MPLRPHARTLAITRFLRAAAPAQHRRRGGRMPRQQQPDLVRLEYFKALAPLVHVQLAPAREVRSEILRLLAEERALERGDAHLDAGERGARAAELVEKAARESARLFRPREIAQVAEKFGRRASEHQRAQLDRQVRQAIGVPLTSVEQPVRDLIPTFAKANTELVRTIPERYFDRLAKDVGEAFETGMGADTLAERFVDLDDMAESDARRVARDQIGKLNADFNQARQEALGVTGYVWRGAQDNRERDNHDALEGEECDWLDPPLGGGTTEDEEGHPGQGILCRCYAEPLLDAIIDDL